MFYTTTITAAGDRFYPSRANMLNFKCGGRWRSRRPWFASLGLRGGRWRSRRPCACVRCCGAGGEAGGPVLASVAAGPVAKPAALCGAAHDFQFHTPPLPQFAYLFSAGRWRSRRPCAARHAISSFTLPRYRSSPTSLARAGGEAGGLVRREAERRKPHGRAPH